MYATVIFNTFFTSQKYFTLLKLLLYSHQWHSLAIAVLQPSSINHIQSLITRLFCLMLLDKSVIKYLHTNKLTVNTFNNRTISTHKELKKGRKEPRVGKSPFSVIRRVIGTESPYKFESTDSLTTKSKQFWMKDVLSSAKPISNGKFRKLNFFIISWEARSALLHVNTPWPTLRKSIWHTATSEQLFFFFF